MHNSTARRRVTIGLAVMTVGAIALSACASERSTDGDDAEAASGGTFVFAASADPVSLDPALASDGETGRINQQIFEGLVGYVPGTTEVAPALATGWEISEDGTEYTFTLREGVSFTDDTPFNAEAVCANFDRWYNWTGAMQGQNISNAYQLIFGGFAESDNPDLVGGRYRDCTVDDEYTATIGLTGPFGGMIPSLAMVQFAMQSPTAMEKYDADNIVAEGADVRYGEYATAHPTGTGPFMFESWDRGQQVELVANPDYWGEAPKLDGIIMRTIGDPAARSQALRSGEVDGYDLVAPADIAPLKAEGFQLLNREPLNVLYLGMDQSDPLLADPRIRQAIAHAIDKESLISQTLPEGSEPAVVFVPPGVDGWTDDVTTYEFDLDQTAELLAEAGQPQPVLDFYYPTGTSRPYMPNPEDLYVAISAQLEAAGISVNGVPLKWSPEYLDRIKAQPGHGIFLLGGTAVWNSAEQLGIFFGSPTIEWGFDNPEVFDLIQKARSQPTMETTAAAYEKVNGAVMDFLPGVPIAHVPVTIALSEGVSGFIPSPTTSEVWNTVSLD